MTKLDCAKLCHSEKIYGCFVVTKFHLYHQHECPVLSGCSKSPLMVWGLLTGAQLCVHTPREWCVRMAPQERGYETVNWQGPSKLHRPSPTPTLRKCPQPIQVTPGSYLTKVTGIRCCDLHPSLPGSGSHCPLLMASKWSQQVWETDLSCE
jgi:hypothetical protein